MIILDTDCLSIFEREKFLETSKLRQKLEKFAPEEIFTTIITFEEQMRGWMAYVARAKNVEQQVFAYAKLNQFLENYRQIRIIKFDEKSAEVFKQLKANKIRIGSMDLKIASIAIANKAILISRNLKDFEQVPDLSVQDWMK